MRKSEEIFVVQNKCYRFTKTTTVVANILPTKIENAILEKYFYLLGTTIKKKFNALLPKLDVVSDKVGNYYFLDGSLVTWQTLAKQHSLLYHFAHPQTMYYLHNPFVLENLNLLEVWRGAESLE